MRNVLKMVRMEGSASNKYKNCSLGMKQRIGIAMALLGHPELLVLDEPINGLDADGMRIMREILVDLTQNHGCTVLISSHILGELEKIATRYGIIRGGRMIKEMTAEELDAGCRTYVALKAGNMERTRNLLDRRYSCTEEDENGCLRVYDAEDPEEIVVYLYKNGILVSEIQKMCIRDRLSAEDLKNKIAVLTGVRAAEHLVFGQITTGAANDIEQATKLARAMVTRYGMAEEFGMVAMERVENVYLGGENSMQCSEAIAEEIDRKVIALVKEQQERADNLLRENKTRLHLSLIHISRVFEKYDDLNASVQENVPAIRVVKSFVREDYDKQKFGKAADTLSWSR